MIERARKFVAEKHLKPSSEQRYGGKPYTFHTDMVASNATRYSYLLSEDKRENAIVSAHGHDLLEDTDTTQKDLIKIFNEVVADTIFRVTDERGFSKKEMLFKTLPKIWQSELATFVKLCDRMANGRNSKTEATKKGRKMFKRYKKQYPIFRYALKVEEFKHFQPMWDELDEIFEWNL